MSQGGSLVGQQAVRVLGWGQEAGERFWRVANSWGREWGEEGTFRIRRGEGGRTDCLYRDPPLGTNEARIEEFVLGAWPRPLRSVRRRGRRGRRRRRR